MPHEFRTMNCRLVSSYPTATTQWPSQDCLPGTGHRNDPRLGDTRAFKALVDRKAEYKGITFREAAAHLRCVLDYARVGRNQVLLGIAVGQGRRALGKLGDVIGPIGFGRSTELGDGFDSVANLRSGIVIDGAFDHSLIIINEQARGREFLRALLALVELDCARNAVAGAASELPLVVLPAGIRIADQWRAAALAGSGRGVPHTRNRGHPAGL